MTKVFTATLLADMVLTGMVALDDPVQDYLPDGVVLGVRGRPITLVDLATHTSGLPRLPRGMLRRSLQEHRNPYARYSVHDLYAALPATRLKNAPGAKIRYSNFGFGLLGHVLSLRAGRSYGQLLRERICQPLGLHDTGISVPVAARPRFARGHNRRGRPVPHWDIPTLARAGVLRSTVGDLLAFLRLHLHGTGSALAEAAALTHEPRALRGRVAMCLGWLQLSPRGQQVLFHDGGTGGFRSFVGMVKETCTAVVILSNTRPGQSLLLAFDC
ncbi:MAG: serine hydrolase domain-containing protein [Pseudonocardiaceae bacterium]